MWLEHQLPQEVHVEDGGWGKQEEEIKEGSEDNSACSVSLRSHEVPVEFAEISQRLTGRLGRLIVVLKFRHRFFGVDVALLVNFTAILVGEGASWVIG